MISIECMLCEGSIFWMPTLDGSDSVSKDICERCSREGKYDSDNDCRDDGDRSGDSDDRDGLRRVWGTEDLLANPRDPLPYVC